MAFTTQPWLRAVLAASMAALAPVSQVEASLRFPPLGGRLGEPSVMTKRALETPLRSPAPVSPAAVVMPEAVGERVRGIAVEIGPGIDAVAAGSLEGVGEALCAGLLWREVAFCPD